MHRLSSRQAYVLQIIALTAISFCTLQDAGFSAAYVSRFCSNSKAGSRTLHMRHAKKASLTLSTHDAIGIDEVGRGCLAGPVVVAAVAISHGAVLPTGVMDSKLLSAAQREEVYKKLQGSAGVHFEVAIRDHKRIDKINILEATLEAMSEAALAVQKRARHCQKFLIDGNRIPELLKKFDSEAVVKGDTKVFQIAAASIIAKVRRDEIMDRLHKIHPQYHFHKNKGYPTPKHLDALEKFGPTEIHRRSYRPVKRLLELASPDN